MGIDRGSSTLVSTRRFTLVFVVAFFVVAFALAACAQEKESNMILELRDVQFFQVKQVASTPRTKIELSGLTFHSSLAVREITMIQSGDSLQLLVHLTPAAAGLSGSFKHIVTIPSSVNVMAFGQENVIFWKRNQI